MFHTKNGATKLTVLTGLLFSAFGVHALEFKPGAGVGLEYSDNASLRPDNEEDDWIAIGYVGASIAESTGPVRANATTSLTYQNYQDSTFGDKYYFDLGADARWDAIRDRLQVELRDYYTQRYVDSLNADTPSNVQDTNVFTFRPNATFPISARNSLLISPSYSNYYYEESDADNQQYGLNASWLYSMYSNLNVSLNGGVRQIKYDDEDSNPDYIIRDIHLGLAGQRARSTYSVNVGATHIDRDRFENQNGFTGNINWLLELTGRSSIRAYVATELRDAGSGLLNSEIDPGTGDFSNEQISSDVVQNDIIRVGYNRKGSTLDARLWGELRDADYKETPDDREVKEVGADLTYHLSALTTAGAYGSYNNSKETDAGRRDKTYDIGADIGYRLSRNLRTVFDLRYRDRSSNLDSQEYSELSAFASLVYGYGDVSRASGGGGR